MTDSCMCVECVFTRQLMSERPTQPIPHETLDEVAKAWDAERSGRHAIPAIPTVTPTCECPTRNIRPPTDPGREKPCLSG